MKGVGARSLAIAAVTAGCLGLLHALGVGLYLLFALVVLIGFVAWLLPAMGVRWLDALVLWMRGRFWAREQGHFHSFSGIPLDIEDDGRHLWVDGEGLLRVLGQREADAVLAARHAGHWRRDDRGALMLRVDSVVQRLATMPGRTDPRVQRLRRYFEREVLFPASRRHDRKRPPPA